jgi:hypothetical protein
MEAPREGSNERNLLGTSRSAANAPAGDAAWRGIVAAHRTHASRAAGNGRLGRPRGPRMPRAGGAARITRPMTAANRCIEGSLISEMPQPRCLRACCERPSRTGS